MRKKNMFVTLMSVAFLFVLSSAAHAQTAAVFSIDSPDRQTVAPGDTITVTVKASFNQPIAACEWVLSTEGSAGAIITGRTVPAGLTYLSTNPADPYALDVPFDLMAAGWTKDVFSGLLMAHRPGDLEDGITAGTDVLLATYAIQVSGQGPLTLTLSYPVASHTQGAPAGVLFDSISLETASITLTVQPNTVAPDLDSDSDVDLGDFAVFQSCFNGPNRPPAQAGCEQSDFDSDSDVDLCDFAKFQTCFNGPNRPPACSQK